MIKYPRITVRLEPSRDRYPTKKLGAVPWVPEVFSHVRRGASFRRPTRVSGKPETVHEKPLTPRVREQRPHRPLVHRWLGN